MSDIFLQHLKNLNLVRRHKPKQDDPLPRTPTHPALDDPLPRTPTPPALNDLFPREAVEWAESMSRWLGQEAPPPEQVFRENLRDLWDRQLRECRPDLARSLPELTIPLVRLPEALVSHLMSSRGGGVGGELQKKERLVPHAVVTRQARRRRKDKGSVSSAKKAPSSVVVKKRTALHVYLGVRM